ncbi:hypothetical protein SD37_06080 [Amycolatopsis orientalis]|uniref:Uncharacterized protein n=1 Tax=Amycolatopsis orientalis TaxID=31958 RepID=A0A193BSW0_AMYOR|nr:hypothetical protein [Amycolatopsis orientalis]ANN15264.1 hypothetical protein SD37_06080 [Amycolatopsis orientalis]
MPEGNPLVAKAPTDGDGPGPLTAGNSEYGYAAGIGVAESAMDAFNGISNGDWVGGGLGVLSLAGEIASAAIDPFGYLMSSVASFLMEHMQPLKDMLDAVAGDPPVIQSYSETWGNVAKKLEDTQVEFSNTVKNGTSGWTGEAGDQYRKQAAEQAEAISAAATVAGGISTVVMIFGEIVAFVREFIRQLIADAVGKLIAWVMETVFSLGFGTPVVVAQAVTAIAKWAAKIADKLKELCDAMRRVSPLLGKLVDVFEKIIKIFGKIAGKVTGLDALNPKNIKAGGFVQRGGRGGGSGGPDGGGTGSGNGPDGDGSHGSGDGSDGSNGSDGDSGRSGDSGSGDSGSNGSNGSGGSRPGDSGSDSPSSTARGGDGGGSPSTRDSGGSPSRSDGGSPGRTGDGDTPSTSDGNLGRAPDGGGSSPRSDGGSPTHTGDGGSPSAARADAPAPHTRTDGGSPSPARADSGPAPQTRTDTGGSPSHTPDGGSPAPHTRTDTGGSPGHTPDGGSPAPHTRTDTSGSPTHTPDSGSPAPHTRSDTGGSPSHTPDGGSPAPHTRTDTGGSPSHTGDGGVPPRTHGGDGGGTPTPRSDPSPGHHAGNDGGSPTRPTDSGTTTSGTAPTAPRLGDAGPSHVPSQRGGPGGDSSPGVPSQGQPVAGGMPPQGAPGGGTPGGTPGSPGSRPPGGGWTGTPGSPRTPDTHAPRTPDTNTGPSRGPGQTGPGGRPNQPHQPQPVARGNDFGPGAQPHTGTPGTHGPGSRPGGTGPGNTGPGGRGPGGHSGPPHSPDGHGPDGHGPRQDPNGHPDGSPHDRGPDDGQPDRPLTPDEVNQRHSESTPAGSSYHRGDPDMGDLPHRVQPDPDGRYTVDVHVTPDGHARIGNRTYTPEEFADILRRNGDYDGRPIRLIGCDAGSNDFARRLSRELDTEVMAPSRPAWTDSNGRVFSSDYEIGPDGRTRPRIPPNGEWDIHSPDGTARRASDDGFTPDTSHADKQDVDADSARSRGDGDEPPDRDADTSTSGQGNQPQHPNRNPESRQQEQDLLDPDRQRERRQNPQRVTDFTPQSSGDPIPVRPNDPPPGAPRAPRAHEPFPGNQRLEPNRSYEVRDADGNPRGTYHTDGTGRVTHIDTSQPNVPHRMPDGSPNPDYRANPDLLHAQPNTTYRVEIDGEHQVFRTGDNGIPEPAVRFHRPDFPADRHVDIGPDHPGSPTPPRPGQPFVARTDLQENTAYRVHDSNGDYRGTYYTDGNGRVRWAEVESGRIARTNPDLANMPRADIGEVRLVQRIDPDAETPPGVRNPQDFEGSTRRDVTLDKNKSFFDDHTPPLEPNSRYVVESEYKDGDKTVTRQRAVYWTDEHGNIRLAETYQPHHPDLNYPKPNMVYNVDGGRFVYETGPEVGNRHTSRSYDTDTVAHTSHDLERADKHEIDRRDESSQKRGGGVEGKEPELDADGNPTGRNINKYDGGHIAGNQFRGPGELLNMLGQWRAQNQGLHSAGDAHWYAFESDLSDFLDPKKHTDGATRSIEQVDTFALRADGDRAPHTLQVRWVENVTDADGNVVRTVRIRSFPNVPPSAGSGAGGGT